MLTKKALVVLNVDELTESEMQEIAFRVGFNETAFPVKSEAADLRIRFFTPGHKMKPNNKQLLEILKEMLKHLYISFA